MHGRILELALGKVREAAGLRPQQRVAKEVVDAIKQRIRTRFEYLRVQRDNVALPEHRRRETLEKGAKKKRFQRLSQE